MHIKEDTKEEKYSEFLDTYRIRSLVKKYSDYIRYPIRMEVEKTRAKEGAENEYEHYFEVETLNSMVPLWKKNKNEITAEEYNSFYKEKFYDWQDPLKVIHTSAEGTATYNALLFILQKRRWIIIRETTKRVCSCMLPAYSLWKSAQTCCRITSAL